jgi:hypothetical protein
LQDDKIVFQIILFRFVYPPFLKSGFIIDFYSIILKKEALFVSTAGIFSYYLVNQSE